MIKVGGSGIADVRVGDAAIAEVRIGNEIVYQSATRGGKWTLSFTYGVNPHQTDLTWNGQNWSGNLVYTNFVLSRIDDSRWQLHISNSSESDTVYTNAGKTAKSLSFDDTKIGITRIRAAWSAN